MTKTYGLALRPSDDVFTQYTSISDCLYDMTSMSNILNSIIAKVCTVESQIIPVFLSVYYNE